MLGAPDANVPCERSTVVAPWRHGAMAGWRNDCITNARELGIKKGTFYKLEQGDSAQRRGVSQTHVV